MAIKTLICGLSGTGKSRSAKTFAEAGINVAVVNPVNKPLPFKNKFEMLNGETDSRKIVNFMKQVVKDGTKHIVVDDFQYLLSIPYMRRIKESGWDKYNDFAANYYDIISVCDELPNDVTVYFMTHTETLEDGQETVKLIGKLLREKICIEGLFTIVLKTLVNDGRYYFVTQNNGRDNVKSPEDMFPSYAIDNDLKYVDDKIRNYYEIGKFLSDEEMAEIDEEAKRVEVIKDDGKKKSRRRNNDNNSEPASTEQSTTSEDEAKPARRSRRTTAEDVAERESEREAIQKRNSEKLANAGLENGENEEGVPFDEVEKPELEKVPRRRKVRSEEFMNVPDMQEESQEEADDSTPRRRRRRAE